MRFTQKKKNTDSGTNMLNEMGPKTSLNDSVPVNTSEIIELKLPELKGLRINVLKLIFDKLTNKELLKMGLVCKEFYSLSREDRFWKSFMEKVNFYLFYFFY
jgi:hypothetical protein